MGGLTRNLTFLTFATFINKNVSGAQLEPSHQDLTYSTPWALDSLLPNDTKPINYNLYLDPALDEGEFYGRVSITLELKAPRDTIILHVKNLNITSTQFMTDELLAISVKNAFEYEPNEFWVVQLERTVKPGKYILRMDFNGSLTRSIVGFYRSSYVAPNGVVKYLASTKFEPTYARRCFPCFDEPGYKATFSIRLAHSDSDGYFALSNMNQISEEVGYPKPGKVTAMFATTPPMATYLACFIVCDFEKLPPVVANRTAVTVFARSGQIQNTKLARDLAVKVLQWFTDYFKIEYPLGKLDLIAIPDFVSGAMENWGLVTFRESHLLANNETSATDMMAVMTTVAHELAHMWFGDLVTMSWWDDLWLNEGFATFLATKVLSEIHDNRQFRSDSLQTVHNVLEEDAEVSSHPIIQQVRHPDQITEIFDAISYSKGSAILTMIEDFDPPGFQTAVSRYLSEFKYRNAHTSDLWAYLAVELRQIEDLPRMLDTWTKQMGYPILSVERVEGHLVFEQKKYLTNAKSNFIDNDSVFKYRWDVPIKYITSRNSSKPDSAIFKMEKKNLKVPLLEGVHWFKVNAGQVGFYRVNYTESEWTNLKNFLEDDPNIMLPEDRANLIDDAFSLAESGYVDYSVPLELVSYLKSGKETHWLPWSVVSGHTAILLLPLRNSKDSSDLLKAYIGRLVESVYHDSIWNIDNSAPISEKLFKSVIANLACRLSLPSAMTKVNQVFSDWVEGGNKPQIDIRKTIYTYGSFIKANWEDLWDLYVVEQDPLEKNMLRFALAKVNDPKLLTTLLGYMKNESYVRGQDYFMFMYIMASTKEGNTIVWDYLRQNWDYLVNRFTLNDRLFGRLLPKVAGQFYDEALLNELILFIDKYPEAGAGASGRKRAVERANWNIIWTQTYLPNLKLWLNTHS